MSFGRRKTSEKQRKYSLTSLGKLGKMHSLRRDAGVHDIRRPGRGWIGAG
jgi:hypothetical protein